MGKLYLFVASDSTSTFAFTARKLLRDLIETVPCIIHAVPTDHGITVAVIATPAPLFGIGFAMGTLSSTDSPK